jgi:glycosyltransferase involved in cell wall biosynthesis
VLSSQKKYDVVFVTSPQLFTGITGIVAKYKYKAKFIFDIRDLWPESVKHVGIYKQKDITLKLAYKLEKYILRKANAILVNSKGFLPYLKDKKVIDKVYYMPNSISEEELIRNINFKNTESQIANSLSIVYAGNIGLAQDLRVLVRLADKLKDRKNISFTIIGTGVQENKLKEEIKKQGLNNIIFKGVLPRKDTLKEIGKHDLAFLHLKNEEVFKTVIPGKLIDYMSIGMPILAGVEGEAKRVINESGCGYAFKPGDYNSMAERILSIAEEGKCSYSSMGIKGVDYIKQNFIWEKNIQIFEDIVYKLTSRKTIVEKKQIKYI